MACPDVFDDLGVICAQELARVVVFENDCFTLEKVFTIFVSYHVFVHLSLFFGSDFE